MHLKIGANRAERGVIREQTEEIETRNGSGEPIHRNDAAARAVFLLRLRRNSEGAACASAGGVASRLQISLAMIKIWATPARADPSKTRTSSRSKGKNSVAGTRRYPLRCP